MRRCINSFAVLLVLILCFSGCMGGSYGDRFDSLAQLEQAMKKSGLKLQYPSDFLSEEAAEYQFVAQKNGESEVLEGYKLYRFGSPFFVGVYGYRSVYNTVQSDNPQRLEKLEPLKSGRYGTIEIYAGKGYEDALFLIGVVHLEGNQYECRVTANKDRNDNAYTNAIYRDNQRYGQALETIKAELESL